MRVDAAEFRSLDLRCHSLLRDVPLHDVWAIPLAGGGAGRSMQDVRAISPFGRPSSSAAVRGLIALRYQLGRIFRWDEPREESSGDSYVQRLTDADRSRSLLPPGTREGGFRMLYLFPEEAVAEVQNATVHAFLATALRARSEGYLLYWAIYVRPVGPITGAYMTLIDPFRRLVVYPALIRQTQAAWADAYG